MDAANALVPGQLLQWDATANILTLLHDALVPNTIYKVVIDADAVVNSDLFGNDPIEWTFTTGSAALTSIVKSNLAISSINIFPNPASDFIRIQSPENRAVSGYQMFTANGTFIKSLESKTEQSVVNLNISDLPEGIYFIVPSGKTNAKAAKFIKP